MREDVSGGVHRGAGTGGGGMRRGGKRRLWYGYFWIWAIAYFVLGFFNIAFAWLGMLDFLVPLVLAAGAGNKWFCNHLCGRGQLFDVLGAGLGWSRGRPTPRFLGSKGFRYGFLAFFMAMFGNVAVQTWLVAGGAKSLREAVTLLWTFRVPWGWAHGAWPGMPEWAVQFAYGFYSLMLTSAIVGLVAMALWKPRSWCVFCPMGTMTQGICRWRNGGGRKQDS